MNKYKIILEGRNCYIEIDGVVNAHGFFATRFIEAEDPGIAEKRAADLVQEELKGILLNDPSNPPLIHLAEIHELPSFDDNLVPGGGFSWYPENGE